MALDADEAGGRQLIHLLARHFVRAPHRAANDEDRCLRLVLLKQGIQDGVIVIIAVVKCQNDRFFIVLNVRKVGKPDRFIPVFLKPFELCLHVRRTDKQIGIAPDVIAHGVVHEDGHVVAVRDLPDGLSLCEVAQPVRFLPPFQPESLLDICQRHIVLMHVGNKRKIVQQRLRIGQPQRRDCLQHTAAFGPLHLSRAPSLRQASKQPDRLRRNERILLLRLLNDALSRDGLRLLARLLMHLLNRLGNSLRQ